MPLLYRPDGTVVDSDTGQLLGQQGAVTPTLNVNLAGSSQQASTPTPAPQPQRPSTFQYNGQTYNSSGQLLDSNGNVAFGNWPGAAGGGANQPISTTSLNGAAPPVAGTQPITSDSFLREDGTFDWVGYANAQTNEPRFFVPGSEGNITLPFLQDTQFQLPASSAPVFDLNTAQFLQNAYQYNNDFNETVRRFNLEFPESQRQANLAAFGRTFAPGGQYLSVR